MTAPRDQPAAISAFKKKPVSVKSVIVETAVITGIDGQCYQTNSRPFLMYLVVDQHDIIRKILDWLTTPTSKRRDLMIHLLLTSTSTRWNSRATGATELSSNNLTRRRTLMGFHIQRLGGNPLRACDEILMQRCVGLYISRCPTTMTNSKSP